MKPLRELGPILGSKLNAGVRRDDSRGVNLGGKGPQDQPSRKTCFPDTVAGAEAILTG